MEKRTSYAVVWDDPMSSDPTTGQLLLVDHHVLLVGNAPSARRSIEFDVGDVRSMEVVRVPEARLRGKPTLALRLADGTMLRITELSGFGVVGEIADAIAA